MSLAQMRRLSRRLTRRHVGDNFTGRQGRSFACTSRGTDVGHSFEDADDFCELLADKKKSGSRTTASNLRRPHNVAAYIRRCDN